MKTILLLLLAGTLHAQQPQGPRPTWSGTYANRPTSATIGTQYVVTDDSAVGACAGGGSAKSACWWNGTIWTALGGNSFTLPTMTVSGATTVAPFPACPVTGFDRTILYSADLTAASQTISVAIGTAPADWVWDSAWGRETVTFAGTGITTASVSIGPSGAETAVLPAVGLKQTTNTTTAFSPGYSPGHAAAAIVAQFIVTSGAGNWSAASAGTYDIRVCGHAGR